MASSGRLKNSNQSPFKKLHAKYGRSLQCQNLLYSDILQSQQTDANGALADALLVCNGGTVRVHTFILQAASQFFQDALASQGENYPFIREILMPDFSIKEVEHMLSLIYKGYVDLRNNKEVQLLKDTLQFFQISGVEFSGKSKFDKLEGDLKVLELNRIPQDIFKPAPAKEQNGEPDDTKPKVIVIPASKAKAAKAEPPPPATDQLPVRRSGRARKPVLKVDEAAGDNDKDDDSDYTAPDSGDDHSVEEFSGDEEGPKRRGRRPATTACVVKLPRVLSPQKKTIVNQTPSTSTSTVSTVARTPIVASVNSSANNSMDENKEASDTDSEDEGWESPNFKDKGWFSRESRRCQHCNKQFDKPAEASLCITSHKCLRCYFCFKVYSTTDILFRHFRKRHKQAGRESTLICPFCDQAIPYKSVSCHVISVHLKTLAGDTDSKPGKSNAITTSSTPKYNEIRRGPGRPISTTIVPTVPLAGSSSSTNPPRKVLETTSPTQGTIAKKGIKRPLKLPKMKKDQSTRILKVPNLDLIVEKRSHGRLITWKLQKTRLQASSVAEINAS